MRTIDLPQVLRSRSDTDDPGVRRQGRYAGHMEETVQDSEERGRVGTPSARRVELSLLPAPAVRRTVRDREAIHHPGGAGYRLDAGGTKG